MRRASSTVGGRRARIVARLVVALAALLLPSLAAVAAPGGPSEVVFPPQQLPLRFSHRQHLGFKLACDFCHDAAASSTVSSDVLIPSEEACRTCHKIDHKVPDKQARPAARCDACHVCSPTAAGAPVDVARPPPVAVPPPNLKFNHKVHLDRHMPCERCHGDMLNVDLATRAQLPSMPLCLECHTQTATDHRAPGRCSTCHPTRPDGTLETDFPTGRLAPSGILKGDAHTIEFTRDHGRVAKDQQRYCESCHRQDFCLGCHNGVVRPMQIHPSDYVSIHAVDARKATTDCNACHRRQTFCLGCHERLGFVDQATANAPNRFTTTTRRFHPPANVWVNAPRTPEHHSWQAERNMRQCVACHREDTCLQCHASNNPTGAFHVSPHPPGFAHSGQCKAVASRNARVCLKCHAVADAHLQCQ